MVEESRSLEAVGGSTGLLNTIGHSRWTAGEHADLRQKDVVFLQAVKELVEVWSTKVGDSTQAGEETAARNLLEVPLTDVLEK